MSYYLMSISLPGDMLKKVDMMSMMNSLEVRVPMLDNHLVDKFLRLPHTYKVNRYNAKILLRKLTEERLGSEIAQEKVGICSTSR